MTLLRCTEITANDVIMANTSPLPTSIQLSHHAQSSRILLKKAMRSSDFIRLDDICDTLAKIRPSQIASHAHSVHSVAWMSEYFVYVLQGEMMFEWYRLYPTKHFCLKKIIGSTKSLSKIYGGDKNNPFVSCTTFQTIYCSSYTIIMSSGISYSIPV
jgi:hypothetical protein